MKHSLVKQTIIETASQLFYKNGYNLTGINEIISTAGIAKATLYNHFKSKEDICIAYLKHKNNVFLKEIKHFCLKAPSGQGQLIALFDFLDKFFKNKDFNGCWCIKTVAEIPKDNEKIRTEIQYQKNQFIQLIGFLIDSNFPNNSQQKNDVIVKQVYILYEAAVAESHLHQDNWPISSAREVCRYIIS